MTRPDMVLLSVDSLRYDAVFDKEGRVREGLPGFERLVENGVSYSDAWSTASYTVGSVRSILSGSYQWSYPGDPYEADRPHIAEQFKDIGYATGGFHSNPLLHERHGWDRGFDHYFTGGFEESGGGTWNTLQNLVTKFDVTSQMAQTLMSFVGRHTGRDIRGRGKPYIPAGELHERAVEWADAQQKPTFLWIHYMDVHNPWYPHEGTASADVDKSRLMQSFYRARESASSITETDRKRLKLAYRGSVQNFDRCLNSLLDELAQVLDDPVICLASDHGELFGEQGTYLHPASVYAKLLHVPLIFATPDESPTERAPVSNVDIAPTLLSMAGGDAPSGMEGRDLTADEGFEEREVFGASSDELRVVSQDQNATYDVTALRTASGLSDTARKHAERLDSSEESGRTIDDDKGELDEQLEALGYK